MAQLNHYQILRVTMGASKSDITAAYRRLCKLYHPDINREPGAEERMKEINVAYHILRDEARRREYDRQLRFQGAAQPAPPPRPAAEPRPEARAEAPPPKSGESARRWFFAGFRTAKKEKEEKDREQAQAREAQEQAAAALREYFTCLRENRHENAYQLLCRHDREAVTLQSFCKWRTAVGKLFEVESFEMDEGEAVGSLKAEAGIFSRARKYRITVTELNRTDDSREQTQCVKYVLPEDGGWRVFLGYRDLADISKIYDDLSRRQKQNEMSRRWEEYCRQTCREIDMLSMEGLFREARRELYRCRRYGQVMTVACYNVAPRLGASEEEMADIVASCAKTLNKALRVTDIPAYIGNGLFVVLFVELKKRSAGTIVNRMAEKMQKEAWSALGIAVTPRWAWAPYEGGSLKSYIDSLPAQVNL